MQQWWRDAVLYQIYPRSFADSDGDGVGDLPGITARLGHIADLGADGIWLSPFYASPWADGGYDVSDFRAVDPRLGTLEDFDAMVAAAHGLGLRVMVDIVPNHTSEEHPWFRDALAAGPGSSERDLYVFRDGRGEDGGLPPTNWRSTFGGPAWTRVEDGQWYLHLFAREQPDLNWDEPRVREEFRGILRFWSGRGVDGFRIDVAYALVKDLREPLRDLVLVDGGRFEDIAANPDHPLLDRPGVHEVYRDWRRVLAEFDPPRATVGEVWLPGDRRRLYTRPDELDQAFNFDFLRTEWDADSYRRVIDASIADAAHVGTAPTWVVGNHDVVRPVSVLGLPRGTDQGTWLLSDGRDPEPDLELGTRRARALALLELALPGSAYVYQGEELGLPEAAGLPAEALEDPRWERSGRTDKGRDGCRVPLPWTPDGPSYGFGAGGSWLPQPEGWGRWSVEAESGDPGSVLNLYRRALAHRPDFCADRTLVWDDTLNLGPVLAFWRGPGVLVLVNTGREPVELPPGEVLVASTELDGRLPGDAAVWLRRV
ncbi:MULTISPECIES: glycoside hydrolase family 13 protein [Nocardiopsidaceae]|uniref:Glycoside hydrolase family 13 protein n=1 Tax=Streptomonospora nanhaiensis TaxID=1323731 RepID=A0ABY6YR93_9ACTN|nr:glycoside hydrolase family 13 protein [Streptomonospora nanhaiensis]WAE74862.1 glycoside hydrolase family 13 protein [Streptomonospora nanhaiensis]